MILRWHSRRTRARVCGLIHGLSTLAPSPAACHAWLQSADPEPWLALCGCCSVFVAAAGGVNLRVHCQCLWSRCCLERGGSLVNGVFVGG
jgi:hypothetical protein